MGGVGPQRVRFRSLGPRPWSMTACPGDELELPTQTGRSLDRDRTPEVEGKSRYSAKGDGRPSALARPVIELFDIGKPQSQGDQLRLQIQLCP